MEHIEDYEQDNDSSNSDSDENSLQAYNGYDANQFEASQYGIYFNDQNDYNYLKHLKPIGDDPGAQFIGVKSNQKQEVSNGIKFVVSLS